MATAIVYTRFSDRPNAKSCDSNEKQEARCRAWCVAKGLEVAGVFADEAESGADANRPGLRMAIDAAKRHKATLVVYDVSRLSRNTAHALAFDAELRKGGASLASITEGFDSSVPMGRFMLTLLGAMATLYRETAAERTSRGMRERQRKGIAVCPKAPYGFRIEGKALVKDEQEQRVLNRISTWHSLDWSAARIAMELMECGHTARNGKQWHPRVVARILKRIAENRQPEVTCAQD